MCYLSGKSIVQLVNFLSRVSKMLENDPPASKKWKDALKEAKVF
jgi:hypothetical protein